MGFVWLDHTDQFICKSKVERVRAQLKGWDWVRFSEADYPNTEDAYRGFVSELQCFSLLNPNGKVIYMHGLPSFEAKLPKLIGGLSSSTVLVLASEIRRDSALYKAVSKLKDVKVEIDQEPPKVDVEWVKNRAMLLGAEIEDYACRVLLEFVGTNPSRLHNELKKLAIFTNGKIASWAVEQVTFGTGDSDIKAFCGALLNKKPELAHELLQRIWDGDGSAFGEKCVKFFGFPMDWSRRLAIVASCSLSESDKEIIGSIKKRQGNTQEPMFPNPKGLWYSKKAFEESERSGRWVLRLIKEISELQLELRKMPVSKQGEAIVMLHHWVDRMCGSNQ